MAGHRGANQGPTRLGCARPGLAGDRLSEAARRARLTESARFEGPRCVCVCFVIYMDLISKETESIHLISSVPFYVFIFNSWTKFCNLQPLQKSYRGICES